MSDKPSRSRTAADAPVPTAHTRDGAAEQENAKSQTVAELEAMLTPANRVALETIRRVIDEAARPATREEIIAMVDANFDPADREAAWEAYEAAGRPATRDEILATIGRWIAPEVQADYKAAYDAFGAATSREELIAHGDAMLEKDKEKEQG